MQRQKLARHARHQQASARNTQQHQSSYEINSAVESERWNGASSIIAGHITCHLSCTSLSANSRCPSSTGVTPNHNNFQVDTASTPPPAAALVTLCFSCNLPKSKLLPHKHTTSITLSHKRLRLRLKAKRPSLPPERTSQIPSKLLFQGSKIEAQQKHQNSSTAEQQHGNRTRAPPRHSSPSVLCSRALPESLSANGGYRIGSTTTFEAFFCFWRSRTAPPPSAPPPCLKPTV